MHNVTSTLLNALYSYGHLPALDSGEHPGDVLIAAAIGGGVLSFHCESATDRVAYKLAFKHAGELYKEDIIQLYRIFRTECSACFSSVDYCKRSGELSLAGERSRKEITQIFLEYVMEESVSLQTVFKIREIVARSAPDQTERNG